MIISHGGSGVSTGWPSLFMFKIGTIKAVSLITFTGLFLY